MIKLIIIFLIFIFTFLPTCYNFGELILKKIKIEFNKYLTMFTGFVAIIAAFQIAFYPAMTLQLSSNFLLIPGLILCFLLLVLDVLKIKNFKKFYFDKYIFLMIIISAFIFFIYLRSMPHEYWYFDDTFYLPLMYENADTSKLYSVEPRSGEVVNQISSLYTSQGLYMIGSFIIGIYNKLNKIFNLNYGYLANIYYFMAYPAFFMLVCLITGLFKKIKTDFWKKCIFVALFIYSTIFLMIDSNLLNNMIMNGYIGVFASLTMHIPFVLFLFHEYLEGKREYIYIITLTFFAMLSYASFNVFMIFILLYSLISILYILKKEKHLNDFMLMVLPVLLFIPKFAFSNDKLVLIFHIIVIILYLVYFKFNKVFLKFEQIIFKLLKYVLIFVAVLPVLGSIILSVLKMKVNCTVGEYLNFIIDTMFPLFGTNVFHYSYIVITGFSFIFIILYIYYILMNKNKKNYLVIYSLIVLIVFLNPFGIPFISTFLTSETFNRMFILVLNPIIYYYVFSFFLQKINMKKLISIVAICFSLGCILIQLKEFQYWINVVGGSNKLTRIGQENINMSNKLDEYVRKNNIKKVNIATINSELKILNPNMYSLLDRTLKYEPDETFTKRAYYISVLYNLNKGIIKQEYYEKYNNEIEDTFKYLNVNFVTINLDCPDIKDEKIESNVLCGKPKKDKKTLSYEYEMIVDDYYADKKIYNNLLKKLDLVYKNNKYALYHVKGGN